MPELPDVETFKRLLWRNAARKKITRVVVNDARILGGLPVGTLSRRVEDCEIIAVRRHGKHLLARLDKGGWLAFHFGMTGALHFFRDREEKPPFTRVLFDFANNGGHLAYTNKRMIGRVGLIEDAADFIAAERLGPDALDRNFNFAAFKSAVEGTKRDVKSVLMDQELVAGIGNIYSDEILFQARIHPKTRFDRLDPERLKRLYLKMRDVLESAVARGAGSEQFIDRMPKGALLPERKKGGHCPRCGGPLDTLKMGGRTAYFCPRCQN